VAPFSVAVLLGGPRRSDPVANVPKPNPDYGSVTLEASVVIGYWGLIEEDK
jgi:hypothetical protein